MRFFTFLFLLWGLMLGKALAQNGMFVPFGQTKVQFEEYLETRDYIRSVEEPSADTLINLISPEHWATYLFDDGVLYAIEDVRVFKDGDVASRIIESCLDYMKMSSMRVRTLSSNGRFQHYALVEGDRIVEFIVIEEGSRKERVVTLRLKSTSRIYGPRLETESYANQIVRN